MFLIIWSMGKLVIGGVRSCRPFPSKLYCKPCCWNPWVSTPIRKFELVSDDHSASLSYNKQVYCFHAYILPFRVVCSKLVSCSLTETLVDAKEEHDFCMFCITMGDMLLACSPSVLSHSYWQCHITP